MSPHPHHAILIAPATDAVKVAAGAAAVAHMFQVQEDKQMHLEGCKKGYLLHMGVYSRIPLLSFLYIDKHFKTTIPFETHYFWLTLLSIE